MFDAARDQAAGLRQLFAPREAVQLIAVGFTRGDARDRAGAEALACAIARSGRRPLLIDAGSGADRDVESPEAIEIFERVDARLALPEGADARRFARFVQALRPRTGPGVGAFDVVLVAGDALRVADLIAGLARRIVLVGPARADALAHTYSQIKAMHLAHGFARYCTAFVDAGPRERAVASHHRLADTAARFLGATVEFGGVLRAGADVVDWDRFSNPWPAQLPPVPPVSLDAAALPARAVATLPTLTAPPPSCGMALSL